MTGTTRFTENDVFVLNVSDLANRRVAAFVNTTNFARRKTDRGITCIARHQSRCAASGAHHLTATARGDFDIMNRDADWDRLERKAIAGLRSSSRAAHQLRADSQAGRSDNIALFAVLIL